MISYERVRLLLDYEPETGRLVWKLRRVGRCRVGTEVGWTCAEGYRRVIVDGREYSVASVIWLWMTGEWPKGLIDHINRDPADNRWTNLRDVTAGQNMMNRRYPSFAGLPGAHRHGKRFRSRLRVNGQQIRLGTYDTPEEAHAACIKACAAHGVLEFAPVQTPPGRT